MLLKEGLDTDDRIRTLRSMCESKTIAKGKMIMNDIQCNEFAFLGLEMLKRAALRTLSELNKESEYVKQDRVRESLGIPEVDYGDPARQNALIYGILYHLHNDGYAEHLSRVGWCITDKGIKYLGG